MASELTPAPSARLGARPSSRFASDSGDAPRRMSAEVFERLFDEHAERLFSFLAYRTGSHALADDLLSETFERVLCSRRPFDPRRGSERRWLYTIALNLLRDHARRRTHEARLMQTVGAELRGVEPDANLAAVEHRDELHRALATLGEDEREALALRYGADLKLRDVARIVGDRERAVEKRVHRALRKLRDELG
jgi:RNA polymerase sigma factor (sigma-70 family)